jgi:hypothetical protein
MTDQPINLICLVLWLDRLGLSVGVGLGLFCPIVISLWSDLVSGSIFDLLSIVFCQLRFGLGEKCINEGLEPRENKKVAHSTPSQHVSFSVKPILNPLLTAYLCTLLIASNPCPPIMEELSSSWLWDFLPRKFDNEEQHAGKNVLPQRQ